MKVPFSLVDFSGGMKGKKGQFNSADIKHLQDINNFLVERNNTLQSRNGVSELPIELLANDKVLPFVYNDKKYYFVYDPLLNLKYNTTAGSTAFTKSMGGMRHVDMFARDNSSLSVKDYVVKEYNSHTQFLQKTAVTPFALTYSNVASLPEQDDVAKWSVFAEYPATKSILDIHLHLRKLTWESSPTFVFTEHQKPNLNASQLYQINTAHAVKENTFWWNRMFVMDEDFNIITNEIDLANFVSYDSGHEPLTVIDTCDPAVRDSDHAGLQTIRESRYGGSDLTYEVEVMNQGVMFYNREGKLPNMFMQINEEGKTDGVLRDFRTLYLDEVPNGIFKTAPYFTLAEYASQNLFDAPTMRAELRYFDEVLVPPVGNVSDAYFQAFALYNSYLQMFRINDTADNENVKFSYNVKDPENLNDVLKAFLPLTSDSSPAVAIDNVRLNDADGQVRFASPSLANLDTDYKFVHNQELVWQNTELASELPFIFSPNLVIYHDTFDQDPISGGASKRVDPILTFVNNHDSDDQFSLIPRTPYAGGSIGSFVSNDVAFRPIRIIDLVNDATVTTQDADYLPTVVYTQVFGIYKFDSNVDIEFEADDATFPIKLGYFSAQDEFSYTFYPLNNFKSFVTTYTGSANRSSSGWFSSTTVKSEYSFKVYFPSGGNGFSIINTKENQISLAIGFNANGYFSSVVEFDGRMFLASVSAPNRIVFSSTTDFLAFSTVRSLVNAEGDPVVTRGGRQTFGNEVVKALHEANNSLRVITNRRIFSIGSNDQAEIETFDPSDIVTSGKAPITINNFTYFVSGDERDILLAVFSERTQRFEYYSVFSNLNVDDETKITAFIPLTESYRMVVVTEQEIYIGTIIQANQVAWSRLTFDFTVTGVTSSSDTLFLQSNLNMYALTFKESTNLEDGVRASFKLLAPTALANLVNVPKTNINYIGMRLHDVTIVGSFQSNVESGSDSRELVSSDQGDVVDVMNKNYDDIYDSIEFSFEGGQNRVIYLRGSLGV